MTRAAFLALTVAAFGAAAAFATQAQDPFTGGNAEAGSGKTAVCVACHGPAGNSGNPEWPRLAGQGSRYIADALAEYKCGTLPAEQRAAAKCQGRTHPVMSAQAAALAEQDMNDVGAYFAAQPPQAGVASPDAVKAAQVLFRAGDAARGIPACLACHGPTGAGNPAAGYPRLAGQHSVYTAIALRAYRSDAAHAAAQPAQPTERAGSPNGLMMREVARQLTDQEIEALASYVSGLH